MLSNNFMNSSINFNHVILRRRHQRNIIRINQRIQRQRRRIINRISRRRAPINNSNTLLNRIIQLPLQITNDPFTNQLFNGSSFH